MGKLQEAVRGLTLSQVLFFLIAVALFLNWAELHGMNKNLATAIHSLRGIDADLTTPVDVNIPNAVDVNVQQ
jgi:hypothetical protein